MIFQTSSGHSCIYQSYLIFKLVPPASASASVPPQILHLSQLSIFSIHFCMKIQLLYHFLNLCEKVFPSRSQNGLKLNFHADMMEKIKSCNRCKIRHLDARFTKKYFFSNKFNSIFRPFPKLKMLI